MVEATAAARDLLRDHADRAATGVLTDPAAVAAVVGVERIACAAGEWQADVLAGLVEAPPGEDDLGWVVGDVVEQVAAALIAPPHGSVPDAAAVNFEAGHHVIATDAVLLRAAVRAGHRSLEEMPYYRIRYGHRGLRFTTSDSAWLVGMVGAGEGVVSQQVGWVARVLAVRGMPTWLLQRHLDALVEEVAGAVPDADVTGLAATGDALAAQRRAHVADAALRRADDLVAEVLADVASPPAEAIPRVGAVLAAAHADVAAGVVPDDAAVAGWLVDRDPAWTPLVERLRRHDWSVLADRADG